MNNPKSLFKDALVIKHSSSELAPSNPLRRVSQLGDAVVKKEECEDEPNQEEEDDYVHLLRNGNTENPDVELGDVAVKKE